MASRLNNVVPIGQPGSMLDYALAYAAIGWPVFPVHSVDQSTNADTGEIVSRCSCGDAACDRVGKHPRTANGLKDATTSPDAIAAWWGRWPVANIAVATGAPCWVLDIDCKNGKRGDLVLEALERERGMLPATLQARSQSGGRHYFFRGLDSVVNSTDKLGQGVDVRGAGGYIIVEPSRISGTYAFEDWDALSGEAPELAQSPDWLLSAVIGPVFKIKADPIGKRVASPETLADLRSAVAWFDCGDYTTWIDVGMALRSLGDAGFWLWDEWSRPYPKYSAQQARKKWHSFNPTKIAYETIFKRAAILGWQNPNAKSATASKAPKAAPGVTRAEVDISGLLAKATPGKPAAPEIAPHLLTVPGALRFAVEWSRATSKKPQPLFDVQAALALGSTILGRRYRTDNDNWSALYFLNIAKSGAGKEHAKHAIETLLEAAGYGHLVGSGRFASESSIISALVGQPCHVAMLDEFGKSIEESNSAGNWMARGTLKGLIEVWGRAHSVLRPVAYSTAGMSSRQAEELAKRMVRKPSLTIQAMSTPETLFDAMTNKSAVDGFLNRFVTVFSDIGRQPPVPARFIEPPAQLIEWMHDVRNRGPGGNLGGMDVAHDIDPAPITLPIDEAAHRLFAAFGRECDKIADELEAEGLAEMTARNVEIAMRLSLIVAVSLGVQSVTFDAAQWAIDYVRTHSGRTITQLRINMSDGPFHRLYKAVLRLVAEAPASMGITTREIGRRCRPWNQVVKKMQDDCLAALMRDGYIAERQRQSASGRGRTGIAYFLNTVDGVDNASTGDVDA
ncbi:MAG: bifunctional DNA primase/polymerase [Burkholderiaceae bacterium]|nr:bifunctional DNA primase/polymerase [Burkholderiaceae bacterium]